MFGCLPYTKVPLEPSDFAAGWWHGGWNEGHQGYLLPVHEAQLAAYLKLSGYRLGPLIAFNVVLIEYGIKRRVHTR